MGYISPLRSTLEYCAAIWDPYLIKDIKQLEQVHHRGARYVCNKYGKQQSVSALIEKLGWSSLENKIIYGLVAVDVGDYLKPGYKEQGQITRNSGSTTPTP